MISVLWHITNSMSVVLALDIVAEAERGYQTAEMLMRKKPGLH